ncbi:GNAT family N-acetyltransferase [Comamonas sp.]|uniref:GNAT family N-acetyltransferase n=1 Tax=Comamonas sp. TaxID=34028 RepID=UPI003A90E7B4
MNTKNHTDRATLVLREIRPSDRTQWESLYRQYADFYQSPMDGAILQRTWSWLMSPQHPQEAMVAVSATGELLGLAHYRGFPEPLLGQEVGFLDDLFVLPSHRGGGVGRSLIAAVSSIAERRGWPLLRWITAQDNAAARQLYDRLAQPTAWVTYELTPARPGLVPR